MTQKNNSIRSAFQNAFNGFRSVLNSEKNARIHLIATILVIILASILRVSLTAWLWLCLAIVLVWMAELFNTAVEKICDLVEPNHNLVIQASKDMAAAGVLLAALFSVVVGLVIFLPPLIENFKKLF